MNINIVTNESDFLKEYDNYIIGVDKISFNDFEFQPGQPQNVIINYAHEHISYNEQELEQFLKLIRLNGTITIIGQDFWTILKKLLDNQINVEQVNKLFKNKKSVWYLSTIITILTRNHFKILKKRIENYEFTVTATRISD
jgi:16S rRNA G1207 methylase RsmC